LGVYGDGDGQREKRRAAKESGFHKANSLQSDEYQGDGPARAAALVRRNKYLALEGGAKDWLLRSHDKQAGKVASNY
jgi:hypothetical protein